MNVVSLTSVVAVALIGTLQSGDVLDDSPKTATVSFNLVTSAGAPRPIISASFNGHPMPMMIHSNADFFAQLRHAHAATFGVRLTGDHKAYGIDRPGHVSDLGLDRGVVAKLAVGPHVDENAPVVVFEVPQAKLGMLGVAWISQNRVILDYARKQAIIAPTPTFVAAKARALSGTGYVGLPMTYDDTEKRYRVNATINGITRSMTIASASPLTIDSAFARAANLKLGRDGNHAMGPTGTRVDDYTLAAPVRITIGGWISPPISRGNIQDTYGYLNEKRPTDSANANGGNLGGAFLTDTAAVIDFGSRVLYVRRAPSQSRPSP